MAGLIARRLCSSISRIHVCSASVSLSVQRSTCRHLTSTSLTSSQFRSFSNTSRHCGKLDSTAPPRKEKERNPKSAIQEIMESESTRKTQLTTAEKVVEAGKEAGYSMVAIFGLGMVCVAGGCLIYNEFSGGQPSVIFRRSLRLVRKDKQVKDLVGSPFKAYGYSNTVSRGYRHQVYSVDYLMGAYDDLHRQVKYNIQGKQRKAVVTVDMKETKKGSGKFDYYTIKVECTGRPPLLVLDNQYSHISLSSYNDVGGPPSPST